MTNSQNVEFGTQNLVTNANLRIFSIDKFSVEA